MRYAELIDKMNLTQKCALLSGAETFKTRGYPQYGTPQILLSDGPHGLRKQAGDNDHLGLNPSVEATCFPTASAMASSWDTELGEEVGAALGDEAAAQGVSVLLGPGLNMKRSPLCGRNFEYFSEDPYLAGKMAAGYIRGIQSGGIAACPKHFAVNSQELRRMATDSVVDERTLREIYLTGFEIAVREGKAKAIMTSYNMVNGEYANENRHLLVDILRGDWGFDGTVVTDWGGSNDHALGVQRGSTLEMPAPGLDSVRELVKAVGDGKLDEADVNARVDELLSLIFETTGAIQKAPGEFDADAHHALAQKAASQCAVLLKNEEHILPLKAHTKVALIGDFAQTPRYQGAGSSMVRPTRLDNLADALAGTNLDIVGVAPGFDRQGKANEKAENEALALAQKASVVVLALGLDEIKESEGMDRSSILMAGNQVQILKKLSAVNPNIVVVLHCGSAVETSWASDCKALLWAALGGQAGASAVADILVGKVNPSGKLAETWPVSLGDCPVQTHFGGKGRTVEYREGPYIGYRYYQTANVPVAFPFGYGLSYTTFSYSDVTATESEVTFTVTNTGDVAGRETAQVYIGKKTSSLFRPARELKGFAKVSLAPGESKKVTVPLDDKAFRYWNVKTNQWEIEGGLYKIMVGASVTDIMLETELAVQGTDAPNPYDGLELPSYRSCNVRSVSDREFETLLGRPLPDSRVPIDRNMTFGELNHTRSPIAWLTWWVLTAILNASIKKGTPNLNVFFIYNMPLRALAKMTNGMVSMGMVDGLVMECRGFWVIGIVRVLYEFVKSLILNAGTLRQLKEGRENG